MTCVKGDLVNNETFKLPDRGDAKAIHRCAHCNALETEHGPEGKCLFASTTYAEGDLAGIVFNTEPERLLSFFEDDE